MNAGHLAIYSGALSVSQYAIGESHCGISSTHSLAFVVIYIALLTVSGLVIGWALGRSAIRKW